MTQRPPDLSCLPKVLVLLEAVQSPGTGLNILAVVLNVIFLGAWGPLPRVSATFRDREAWVRLWQDFMYSPWDHFQSTCTCRCFCEW